MMSSSMSGSNVFTVVPLTGGLNQRRSTGRSSSDAKRFTFQFSPPPRQRHTIQARTARTRHRQHVRYSRSARKYLGESASSPGRSSCLLHFIGVIRYLSSASKGDAHAEGPRSNNRTSAPKSVLPTGVHGDRISPCTSRARFDLRSLSDMSRGRLPSMRFIRYLSDFALPLPFGLEPSKVSDYSCVAYSGLVPMFVLVLGSQSPAPAANVRQVERASFAYMHRPVPVHAMDACLDDVQPAEAPLPVGHHYLSAAARAFTSFLYTRA